jgi:hypothetical protein
VSVSQVHAFYYLPISAASYTLGTMPTHAAGDRLFIMVGGKYSTASDPTITGGWTLVGSGTGGTGSTGTNIGPTKWALFALDAVSSSTPSPTITAGGTAYNSWTVIAVAMRTTGTWADTIATAAAWVQSASDTNTAAPRTGVCGPFTGAQPTTGDAILGFDISPSNVGINNSAAAVTMTATGLSGGTVTPWPARTTTALGANSSESHSVWTGFTGTASAGLDYAITVTSGTNHSGSVVGVAVREAPSLTVPGAPTSLGQTHDWDQIDLTWAAPATGGAPTSYEVQLNGGTWTNVGLVLAHSFTGLTPNTAYTYGVRGVNGAGNGTAAAGGTTTDYAPPGPPTGLSATPYADTLDLFWGSPLGTPIALGYEVRIDGGTPTDIGLLYTYSWTGLLPDTSYLLEVRAYAAGGTVSTWAGLTPSTLDPTPPTGGYAATITVGDHEWYVESDDPEGYGPLAGMRVGWTARQDDGWPTQHDPFQAVFGVIVEEGDDLSDLDIGQPVAIQLYTDADPDPLVKFGGTVRDLTALPHPRGMVYQVVAQDYLTELKVSPIGAFLPSGSLTEDIWTGGSPATFSGLAMGDANSPPDPFDPPTVPYPGTGSAGTLGSDITVDGTALDIWTRAAGALAFPQAWAAPETRDMRVIFTPNLDADAALDPVKPWVAAYVLKDADPVEIDADKVPTSSVEWRRQYIEPNRAVGIISEAGNERSHPGIPTITRYLDDTPGTIGDTISQWVVLGEEDLPSGWYSTFTVQAWRAPEVVVGWFTMPTAMNKYVVLTNVETRHNPTGTDTHAGMLSSATLVMDGAGRWRVDFTLRRSVPEGIIP